MKYFKNMVNIDDNLKYKCIKCILNIIYKNNCSNNCDSYKCLACNNNYYINNGNIIFGHNPECYNKIKNNPI